MYTYRVGLIISAVNDKIHRITMQYALNHLWPPMPWKVHVFSLGLAPQKHAGYM